MQHSLQFFFHYTIQTAFHSGACTCPLTTPHLLLCSTLGGMDAGEGWEAFVVVPLRGADEKLDVGRARQGPLLDDVLVVGGWGQGADCGGWNRG